MVLDGPDRNIPLAPRLDRTLIRGITLARIWAGQLECGEVVSITALAAAERLCVRYTARLLPLASLAPRRKLRPGLLEVDAKLGYLRAADAATSASVRR